jgi:hypothetical protein
MSVIRDTENEKRGNMETRKRTSTPAKIKNEVRTWYAFEGPSGEIVHNKQFFFAWKEGCLLGTYNTLEKAVESLNRKGKLKPREIQ